MNAGLLESKKIQRLYDQVVRTRRNCAYEDIERLLLAVGFKERRARGSHRVFKLGKHVVTIPQRKPVKENYIEHAISILNELGI